MPQKYFKKVVYFSGKHIYNLIDKPATRREPTSREKDFITFETGHKIGGLGQMFRKILSYFTLPLLLLLSNSSGNSAPQLPGKSLKGQTGTLEKMIVASGNVAMDLDLSRLSGSTKEPQRQTLHFGVAPNSFFTILVFNNVLRGPEKGSMGLLALGSTERDRFHPGMSTEFLARMADLIADAVARR